MKFTEHTMVTRGIDVIQFAPGDEVPEWAEDFVGDHVTDAGNAEESTPAPKDDAKDDSGKSEAEAADVKSEDESAPDFTKPAAKGKAKTASKG